MLDDKFVIENNVLTKYNGQESIVHIPENVVSIGESAFANNNTITGVIISSDCKAIECHAFEKCENLRFVILGDNTETIGFSAFSECKKLEYVKNTISLKTINGYAFEKDKKLVDIPMLFVTKCASTAFKRCSEALVSEINDRLEEINKAQTEILYCAHCGKPICSQNRIVLKNNIQLCCECAFEDYDKYITIRKQKNDLETKIIKSKNRLFKAKSIITFLLCMLIRSATEVGGMITGAIFVLISYLLMFTVWIGIRTLFKRKIAYECPNISDYIAQNQIVLSIKEDKLQAAKKKTIETDNANKNNDLTGESSQKNSVSKNVSNIKSLYNSLSRKEKLSSDELNFLVNDFISRSNKFIFDYEGTYEVIFNQKVGVFNGVLICDETTKTISVFEVLKAYNSKIEIELSSGTSVYYYNVIIQKKAKSVEKQNCLEDKLKNIERLAMLHKNGSLTDEEYEILKKEALK